MKKIISLPDENEIDEMEWLKAVPTNSVLGFLSKPEEDIYSLEDGKLFLLQSSDEINKKS